MPTLTVAPLSTPSCLTLSCWKAIENAAALFLQTKLHPSAKPVLEAGLPYRDMDDLYEACEDYDTLNLAIARRLTEGEGDRVYAIMGDNCGSQLPYIEQCCRERGFALQLLPGVSFSKAAFPDHEQGIRLKANALPEFLTTQLPLYIEELDNPLMAGELKNRLQAYYPDTHPVTLAVMDGEGCYSHKQLPLYQLDRQRGYFSATVLYVPPLPFEDKVRYSFEDLITLLRILRAPGGCPWDREQTHESLKLDLREECFELMDAIDEGDREHLIEELGDVMMLVVFHGIIGEEQGEFDCVDISDDVVKKMIYRHPHVFANVKAENTDEVLNNWEELKKKEKQQQTLTDILRSIPKSFPALLRSQKVQHKARKWGFDYPDAQASFFKIEEETRELKEAMALGQNVEKEMGDLFFACVNVCRLLGLDCEETLQRATEKFIARFDRMEQIALLDGVALKGQPLEVQDAYWEKAKAEERAKDI